MKKLISTIAATLLLAAPVYANSVNVTIDGEYVDAEGVIVDGRTLVPVRAVTELLGATVGWDGSIREVTVDHPNASISLIIDEPNAILNGSPVLLDVPAQIMSDRTFVPLRFVADSFGMEVDFIDGVVVLTSVDGAFVLSPYISFGPLEFLPPSNWEYAIEDDTLVFLYNQSSGHYAIALFLEPSERFGEGELYTSQDRLFWEEVILEHAFEVENVSVEDVGVIGIFDALRTEFSVYDEGTAPTGVSYLLVHGDYVMFVVMLADEDFDFSQTNFFAEVVELIATFTFSN